MLNGIIGGEQNQEQKTEGIKNLENDVKKGKEFLDICRSIGHLSGDHWNFVIGSIVQSIWQMEKHIESLKNDRKG